ncbi:MAG: helix-turn-helix transcriptional regulator [Victivallaceae bacterium]|nr:helix-turn-helix transcriptional regulator [Victivallaceae bacterium]
MTNLKKMLKNKGVKVKTLAMATGVKSCTVSQHNMCGVKTIRIARRYAAVLGCDPLELLEL